MRNFRASECESLLSPNERRRKCRVTKLRGNSSVGRAQPCPNRIRCQPWQGDKCGVSSIGRAQPCPNRIRCQPWQGDKRGNSSVGRAQPCQGWGREFEPRFPL